VRPQALIAFRQTLPTTEKLTQLIHWLLCNGCETEDGFARHFGPNSFAKRSAPCRWPLVFNVAFERQIAVPKGM